VSERSDRAPKCDHNLAAATGYSSGGFEIEPRIGERCELEERPVEGRTLSLRMASTFCRHVARLQHRTCQASDLAKTHSWRSSRMLSVRQPDGRPKTGR